MRSVLRVLYSQSMLANELVRVVQDVLLGIASFLVVSVIASDLQNSAHNYAGRLCCQDQTVNQRCPRDFVRNVGGIARTYGRSHKLYQHSLPDEFSVLVSQPEVIFKQLCSQRCRLT